MFKIIVRTTENDRKWELYDIVEIQVHHKEKRAYVEVRNPLEMDQQRLLEEMACTIRGGKDSVWIPFYSLEIQHA